MRSTPYTGVLSSFTEHVPSYPPSPCIHANSSRCRPTLTTRRNKKSIKRVTVSPVVYPRLFKLLHFDIQSTGQKLRCVDTGRRPSHCSVLIKQLDSPCPFSVLDRYLLHYASPNFPRARLPLSPSACLSRLARPRRVPAKGRAKRARDLAFGVGAHEPKVRLDQCVTREPNLFPKLRIDFADFPCLHCSLSARRYSPRNLLRSIGTRLHELQQTRAASDFLFARLRFASRHFVVSFLFAQTCVRLLSPCSKTGCRGLSSFVRRRSSLPNPSETSEARVGRRTPCRDGRGFVTERHRYRAPRAGRGLLQRQSMTAAEAPKVSQPSDREDCRLDFAVSFPSDGFAFSLTSFVVEASRRICL